MCISANGLLHVPFVVQKQCKEAIVADGVALRSVHAFKVIVGHLRGKAVSGNSTCLHPLRVAQLNVPSDYVARQSLRRASSPFPLSLHLHLFASLRLLSFARAEIFASADPGVILLPWPCLLERQKLFAPSPSSALRTRTRSLCHARCQH